MITSGSGHSHSRCFFFWGVCILMIKLTELSWFYEPRLWVPPRSYKHDLLIQAIYIICWPIRKHGSKDQWYAVWMLTLFLLVLTQYEWKIMIEQDSVSTCLKWILFIHVNWVILDWTWFYDYHDANFIEYD